ncbi:MAG: hypothetical protein HN576_12150 [Bacteriovoracaceae bacterium]|jgi:hypothetical protein|nr:hypothetical protein [Bacteriovoracaceae bacterium]
MKILKVIIRSVVVHASVFALITVPIATSVLAQDGFDKAAQVGIGAIQAIGGQVLQAKQQQAMMQQQAAMMQGMQVQLRPARYFPQCQVPQAQSTIPENACKQVTSPGQLGMVMGMQQAAVKNEALFEQMMSMAQNTPRPQGLQCINEAKKQTAAAMKDKINALTALQTRINKETQLFKEENKRLIEDMAKDNAILNGGTAQGSNGNALDIKAGNLAKNFSQSCRNLNGGIGGINKSIRSGGLMGIVNGKMDNMQTSANTYKSNEGIFKKDIDSMIQKMTKKMAVDGIDNFKMLATDIRGLNPGIVQEVGKLSQEQAVELNEYKKQVQKDINKLGISYEIPNFDRSFAVDFEEFKAGASNFFQKQYVSECVTGDKDNSIGLNTRDIMKGLRHRGVSGGNALPKYRDALQNILDGDSFIEDKLAAIRALDAKFSKGKSRIEISYTDSGAKEVSTSPYNLYMNTVKACQQKFTQNDTFSTGSRSISMKKKVKRLQGYLNNLKRKHDTFVADAANKISDALINCSGADYKSGPGSCNPEALSPGAKGFSCLAHSTKCASEVNSCYAQVTGFIEEKKKALIGKAQIYNQNLGKLVARQEQLLAAVKTQVLQDANFIKNFFPGANYDFPADLFVKMPELSDANPFGVPLRGKPSLDFLKSLPGNIEKLKNQLVQQTKKIDKVISDYTREQNKAISDNKNKWASLKKSCARAEGAFRKQVAATEKKKQEDFTKKKNELNQFCRKFKQLRDYAPSDGACGDVERLHDDSVNIVAFVNGDVTSQLNAYNKFCQQREESDKVADGFASEGEGKLLSRMCEDADNKWDSVKQKIMKSTMAKLPNGMSKSAVRTYINGGEASPALKSEIASADMTGSLKAVRDLMTLKDNNSDDKKNSLVKSKKQWKKELDDTNVAADTSPTDAIKRINALATNAKNPLKDLISKAKDDLAGMNALESQERLTTLTNALKEATHPRNKPETRSADCNPRTGGLKKSEPGPGYAQEMYALEKKACGIIFIKKSFNDARTNIDNYKAPKKININPVTTQSEEYNSATDAYKEVLSAKTPVSAAVEAARKSLVDAIENNQEHLGDTKSQNDDAMENAIKAFGTDQRALASDVEDISKGLVAPARDLARDKNACDSTAGDPKLTEVCEKISENNNSENDPCQNLESELAVESYKRCIDDDTATCMSTISSEKKDSYSGLTLSRKINSKLLTANRGRGLASSSDWDAIGENSDDACEVTASNGRNFAGFDLGSFDMQTGAAPLGNFGLGQ